MPLDVMLHMMRQHWREGGRDEGVDVAGAGAADLNAKPGGTRVAATLAAVEDEQLDELCRGTLDGAPPTSGDQE